MDDLAALTAQDAAEALISLGWPVQPYGDDMEAWIIGDLTWTDEELRALAARHGFSAPTSRLQ